MATPSKSRGGFSGLDDDPSMHDIHRSTISPEWEGFNIERHILVGRIEPSKDGKVGPIEAAFAAIGRYMQENDDAPGYDVSFEVFGRSFRAQIEPDESWINRRKEEDDEY